MRENLLDLGSEKRHTFVGTFERLGIKSGFKGNDLQTILLTNVHLKDDETILTDHLWFNFTKGFAEQKLRSGDLVQFDGRIVLYEKGYYGNKLEVAMEHPSEWDCEISYPTKIINLTRPIKVVKIRRSHEEVLKAKEAERKQKEETERERIEWENEPTLRQLDYMHEISKATGIPCDDLETREEVELYLDCFVKCFHKVQARERSIERFKKVQKEIATGKTMEQICKKLSISASTYRKYKNPKWIETARNYDFSEEIDAFNEAKGEL